LTHTCNFGGSLQATQSGDSRWVGQIVVIVLGRWREEGRIDERRVGASGSRCSRVTRWEVVRCLQRY
jgi:hypothetical protein